MSIVSNLQANDLVVTSNLQANDLVIDSPIQGKNVYRPQIVWTEFDIGSSGARFTDIIHDGSQFVACATGANSEPRYNISTSPDGTTWTNRSLPVAFSEQLASIAYNGSNLYVSINTSDDVYTSSDSITWVRQASALPGTVSFVQWLNGAFYAVGVNNHIYSSTDGITWVERTTEVIAGNNYNEVAFGNGVYIAVASGSDYATSSDGITWTLGTLPTLFDINSILFNGTEFVLLGNGSGDNIATTPDGLTFTYYQDSDLKGGNLAYGRGLYVAPISSGFSDNTKSAASLDNWTDDPDFSESLLFRGAFIFADDKFVGLSNFGDKGIIA